MEIRPYQPRDEQAVVDLWHRLFPPSSPHNEPGLVISRKTDVDDGLFLVARVDGELVGTVIGGYDGHRGWIYRLGVAPEHRGQGIARALVAKIEAELGGRGAVKVNLQLRGENAEVVNLYEGLGYSVEDRISMGKRLFTG